MSPKFSIIIPVKAINDYVRETVSYIQRMSNPNWELFILPNEDCPNEWLGDLRISIVPSGRVGPADKRDMGAKLASGDVLVFLDDDSYPKPNLLDVATKYFADPEVIAIGGPGITPPHDSFWQRVSGAVFLSRFTGGSPERYVSIGNVRLVDDWPSVNLMVRRDVFLDVGGFDCRYWPGEDTKLCLKLVETGKKLLYVPDLIVWHHRRAGFLAHLKQVGSYGLHRGYFARRHPKTSFRLKYFAPTAFGGFVVLSTLWPVLSPLLSTTFVLVWALYIVVLLMGLRDIVRHETWGVGLAALLYVPSTHFYYGMQFVHGYFKQGELVSKLR